MKWRKITHLYTALYFIYSEIPLQTRNQIKFFLLKYSFKNKNNKSKQDVYSLKLFLKLNNERFYKNTLQIMEKFNKGILHSYKYKKKMKNKLQWK